MLGQTTELIQCAVLRSRRDENTAMTEKIHHYVITIFSNKIVDPLPVSGLQSLDIIIGGCDHQTRNAACIICNRIVMVGCRISNKAVA